jgi:hypothetical protein
MNIYSIKEIVQATNNLLKNKAEPKITQTKKKVFLKKKNNLNTEKPLLLKDKISVENQEKIKSFNYTINIKPEIKDRMINELYKFLKKKIKKNTLKLIIDEQIEIKNLKNKINLLKQNKNKLINNYQILKTNYESALKNYEKLTINKEQLNTENNQLKINQEQLDTENQELKINQEKFNTENNQLKINQEQLDTENQELKINKEKLSIEYNEIKIKLKEAKLNLDESLQKNKLFEINNAELKNTISRYIANNKKIQEKLDSFEKSKNLELEGETKKIKFYQDENIRLSSELLFAREKNKHIKENLNSIEIEKENISSKIKELSKSIEEKTNIIATPFIKDTPNKTEKNTDQLNDKEQKSLDEVINRIFAKT